ncbi:MAG: hypothetical protein Q4C49_12780 [Bacillota bacterium]|nr:hypothetical protein [Bacillota bacterium]
MEGFYRYYSNEERLDFAKEVVLLINDYRKYQKEDNVIEEMNTYQRLGKYLLLLSNAVFNITTIKHTGERERFRIQDDGVEESITDAALTMLEKIESDIIDTTGYEEHPEKVISFMKSILEGKLLNLRKKEKTIYIKGKDPYTDSYGQEHDGNEYVTFESMDQEDEEGKTRDYADPGYDQDDMFPEELVHKLREILQEIRETDKDGKYIDYLYGQKKYLKKEIAAIFDVSDSIVSRKEKKLKEKIAKKLLE